MLSGKDGNVSTGGGMGAQGQAGDPGGPGLTGHPGASLAFPRAQGECGNFVRLIQPWNRTHLYVCGTGAYNPMCTYVNRGRRAQVSPGGRPVLPR